MAIEWILGLALVATSLVVAFVSLLGLSLAAARLRPRGTGLLSPTDTGTVLLFDGRTLVDASDAGRALLAQCNGTGDAWMRLMGHLAVQFPTIDADLAGLADSGRLGLAGVGARPLHLQADWRAGIIRLTLSDPQAEGESVLIDRLSLRAAEEELSTLRGTMDSAPMLVWRETADGSVTWANRAYLDTARLLVEDDAPQTWPLPRIFQGEAPANSTASKAARVQLKVPGEKKPRWFETYGFGQAPETLRFALPADAAVQAEAALRDFLQTLTKTFAHLPIGLAIFDRQRQMALFNPALIDLTGLGPEFLSARPTLLSFLDALREQRRMPEQKDYRSWRKQMSALEKAATTGVYEETWALPSGQTYRVVGRPHTDGALALMFQDISAEMTITRRFRADIEIGQSVIDSLEEAIAVFSPAGKLVLTNTAYARLWGSDPSTLVRELGLAEMARDWQARSISAEWADPRDIVAARAGRVARRWSAEIAGGPPLSCRMAPLAGGATLVGFTPLTAQLPSPPAGTADGIAPLPPTVTAARRLRLTAAPDVELRQTV